MYALPSLTSPGLVCAVAVIDGMDIVGLVESVGSSSGRTRSRVEISGSGEL